MTDYEALVRPSRLRRSSETACFFSPLLLLVIWELLARAGLLDDRFFPEPTSVMGTMVDLVQSADFRNDIVATLRRVLVGFALGAVPGLAIGLAMGLVRPLRQILMPIFSSAFPIPKIAILPLIFLVFGLGEMSKYVAVSIGVFFYVLFNTVSGVLQAPPILLDVARNAGATRLQVIRTVALPAALPSIFTGLQLASGIAFIAIAAVEFVGAREGLGAFIWRSWQIFAVEEMYVGIVAIAVMGYAASVLIQWLRRRFVPWADT